MPRYSTPQPPFWFRLSRTLIICGVAGHIVLAGLVLQLSIGLWLLVDATPTIRVVLWLILAVPIAVTCGIVGQWLLRSIEDELAGLSWAWDPPRSQTTRRERRD